MQIDDKSAAEQGRLERLVAEYRETRRRQLGEIARKLWLRTERERRPRALREAPHKIH